jgi:hypothetical protein
MINFLSTHVFGKSAIVRHWDKFYILLWQTYPYPLDFQRIILINKEQYEKVKEILPPPKETISLKITDKISRIKYIHELTPATEKTIKTYLKAERII